jgi:hypothetical protein
MAYVLEIPGGRSTEVTAQERASFSRSAWEALVAWTRNVYGSSVYDAGRGEGIALVHFVRRLYKSKTVRWDQHVLEQILERLVGAEETEALMDKIIFAGGLLDRRRGVWGPGE